MRVYCVWPLNRSWLLLVTLCWLRRQRQVKCWRVGSFCPTLNAPLNFNSPDESWIICFAQLSCSLFSFLFMHDVCLHLISPFLHLNPSQTYFLPLSILFFFTLSVQLSILLTLNGLSITVFCSFCLCLKHCSLSLCLGGKLLERIFNKKHEQDVFITMCSWVREDFVAAEG